MLISLNVVIILLFICIKEHVIHLKYEHLLKVKINKNCILISFSDVCCRFILKMKTIFFLLFE